MIDGNRWQLEKAQSVISNLRLGAPIPLRCIPCSPDAAPIDGFWRSKNALRGKVGTSGAILGSVWRPPPLY